MSSIESQRFPVTDSQLLALIERIYEAAVDVDCWQLVADELARAFGDSPVNIYLQYPGERIERRVYLALLDETVQPMLERHVERGLPWGSDVKPETLEHFVETDRYLEGRNLAETDLYREWMEPNGLAPVGPLCHVWASHDGGPEAAIGILRPLGKDRYEDWELELADRLLPHLRRAWRIHVKLSSLKRRSDVLEEVLDRTPTGVILIDRDCRVVARSRSAEATLERGVGLSLRDGRLHADDGEHDRLLQPLLERLVEKNAPSMGAANAVNIPHSDGRNTIQLLGVPVRAPATTNQRPEAVATLFIGDPDLLRAASGNLLRSLYGLTRAEAELARLLGDGLNLSEAARARGVAENTVRSQLKQVFAKTHTRRQAEVVRLVLSLALNTQPSPRGSE